MSKFSHLVKILASMPKTIVFNLRTFPFKTAIKCPVIIGYNVKVLKTKKGIIEFENPVSMGMVKFGIGGSKGVVANKHGELCLEDGKVVFAGKAKFDEGSSFRLNGNLYVGNNFSAGKNTFISCSADDSYIGTDVLLGWNVAMRDSDGHTVYVDGHAKKSKKSFWIGDHVWICAEAHILKGVHIEKDSVIAYRATVTSTFLEKGCLIAGTPAKVIQKNVNWGDYQETDR